MPYFEKRFSDWQVEPVFIVTNSNNSASELRPLVRLCPCQNNGSCVDDEDVQRQLDSGARFILLSCDCPVGLTGQFCQNNFDACVENNDPCFPGVECVNVPPDVNQTGFMCGLCPSGYHGDGATCIGKTDSCRLLKIELSDAAQENFPFFLVTSFATCSVGCTKLRICKAYFLSQK